MEFDVSNNSQLTAMLNTLAEVKHIPTTTAPPKKSLYQQQGIRKSNQERSGKRDMTISANLRKVGVGSNTLSDDIRHKDNDFTQHCAKCSRAIVYIEGSTDPKKATTYIRAQAEDAKHKAWAVRIIHYNNDTEGLKGVRKISVWENGRTLIAEHENLTWDQVIKAFEKLQIKHIKAGSFGGCTPRKKFN